MLSSVFEVYQTVRSGKKPKYKYLAYLTWVFDGFILAVTIVCRLGGGGGRFGFDPISTIAAGVIAITFLIGCYFFINGNIKTRK